MVPFVALTPRKGIQMPKFDAGTAVEPLEYDFSAYNGPVGVTPEPSDLAFKKFSAKQTKVMVEADKLEREMTEAEKEGRLDEQTMEDFTRRSDALGDRISKLIADLCQDQPSKEDVDKLPYRVKTAYTQHLMAQFSPEAVTSGTKN